MDDSIVDIDEALSDSFSQPTDESFEDINAIVQQWKQSADGNSPQQGTEDKYLNTRTFTRPKRRVYPKCTPNMFATPQPAAAHINLKIGGLVTGGGSSNAANMQRSFLGDISPPSSMCSTSFTSATSVLDQQMAGSLITSNDFTGITYFNMESAAGGVTPTTAECFNEIFETSRPQVFDDISMLNAPYAADEVEDVEEPTLANVDADIDGDTTLADEMEDTFERLTARIGASTADSFIVVESTVSNRRPPACDADDTTNILLVHSSLRDDDQEFGDDADDYAAVQLDATYDNDTLTNRTLVVMDAQQPLNVTVDAVPSVIAEAAEKAATLLANATCVLEEVEDGGSAQTAGGDNVWGRTLNDTFQLDEIQLEAENTFQMGGSMRHMMNDSMSVAAVSSTYPERDYGLQSTPIKAATVPHMSHTLLNDLTTSTVNISPISNHTQQPAVALPTMHATQLTQAPSNKFHTYVRPKASRPPVPIVTTPSFDDELDDLPSPTPPTATTATTDTTHTQQQQQQQHCQAAQRELDERQSLTNFEEFEKSLSLCQNDHDFDDMLNGLASRSQHHRSAADAQMRQSLDHIKKRHSLLNLEKQLEDQQRRHAAHASAAPAPLVCSTTAATAASSDSNRQQLLNSTHTNRTASPSSMLLSTSGSGERLLRRSRVMDEYSSPVRNTTTVMDKSSSPSSSCSTSTTMSDSKENVQNNFDSNRCATAEQSLHAAAPAAAAPHTELKPRSIPNNRDRFKTIRISKRPPEHDAVPHIHDGGKSDASADDCNGGPPSLGSAQGEPQQNDNRALQQQQHQQYQQTSALATASPTLPRRRLTRPSQLSGLAGRRDASLTIGRSNGVQPQQQSQGGAHDHQSALEGGVKKISSPLGTKAKSIQNLVERSSSTEKSADETNARSQKEQSEPVFKIPSGLPTTQRMRSIARPSGLIRPSSGYYSYGVRRNDSDTESGRMSPTNSLSSGSSKGSLYRAEADTASSSDDVLKIELEPIEPPAQEPVQIVAPSAPAPVSRLQQPKRSGIQPPSASGAFAAANRKRSGLPRPMSMANR